MINKQWNVLCNLAERLGYQLDGPHNDWWTIWVGHDESGEVVGKQPDKDGFVVATLDNHYRAWHDKVRCEMHFKLPEVGQWVVYEIMRQLTVKAGRNGYDLIHDPLREEICGLRDMVDGRWIQLHDCENDDFGLPTNQFDSSYAEWPMVEAWLDHREEVTRSFRDYFADLYVEKLKRLSSDE